MPQFLKILTQNSQTKTTLKYSPTYTHDEMDKTSFHLEIAKSHNNS